MPNVKPIKKKIWYPSKDDVVTAHDTMIKAVGGWSGFQVGMQPYETYLKEVKATPGLYRKAAVLLQNIAMGRMFKDGQHRTAFVVTKDFLEHNGGEFKEKDEVKLIRFIKDIRKFSIDEITSWLEYGSTKPPE